MALLVAADVSRAAEVAAPVPGRAAPPDSIGATESAPDTVAIAAAAPPMLPPPRTRAWQVGLLRTDRLQHASFSLTLGLGFGLTTQEPVNAIYGTMTVGVLKEIWDIRTTGFDVMDLLADLAGAGTAAVITSGLLK